VGIFLKCNVQCRVNRYYFIQGSRGGSRTLLSA